MANYSDIKYQPAGSATTTYSDMAALIAATGMSAGDQALVTALNKVFMYTGSAWYLVATMTNDSPTAITGVDGTYALATDGTATTITAISTDPEGFPLTWSYAVTTGSLGSTATVSQADNVFTITPSTTQADAGSFSITFSVTDGATGAVNAVSSFTLTFSVANSRYTSLSVKATNTGSNQTFDDASASNHTITIGAGDPKASTFSPHRHGGYSLGLDGTNDYLQVPQTTDLDLTGDFTVECWAYFNDTAGGSGLLGKWGGSGLFGWTLYATAADFWFYTGNSGSSATQGAFTFGAPAVNQWYHLAVSRTGSTISTYVNGTRTTTITDSNNCTANTTLIVGSDGSSLSAWSVDGYMRDVRIVNGTGLYTGTSITVPTESLTAVTNTKFLLGDLPYFKDQSTSNHAITPNGNVSLAPKSVFDNAPYSEASHGASAYFDGDRLSVADNSEFDVGDSDFTAECWIYPTGSPSQPIIFGQWTSPYSWAILLSNDANRYARMLFFDGSYLDQVSSTVVPLNQWSHMAMVKDGSNGTLYVNGNSVATQGSIGTLTDTNVPLTIGGNSSTAGFTGYIADARFVVGSKLYTSNFTPPTEPLTAITNTKFLFNPETSISDLSQKSEITCFGDAATSTTQVKFAGTKSIYGDGSGDYVSMPIDPIGIDDFTVEAWIYPTNLGSYATPISGATISGAKGTVFGVDSWFVGNNTTFQNFTSAANKIVVDQWQHIAITRQGTSLKLFYNGTQFDSGTNSTDLNQTNYVLFARYTDGSYLDYAGYIQDFRITKGLARYTSNFTPPTAELEG